MEEQNQFPGSLCRIFVDEIRIGAGSSPSTSVFTVNYDLTNASFTQLSSGSGIMGSICGHITNRLSITPTQE
jgi:hypothetical protein